MSVDNSFKSSREYHDNIKQPKAHRAWSNKASTKRNRYVPIEDEKGNIIGSKYVRTDKEAWRDMREKQGMPNGQTFDVVNNTVPYRRDVRIDRSDDNTEAPKV